jgi:WD40 repeat protein
MARRSRTIRVFVSSTFKDMEPERNYLQAHAFKNLAAYCQQHGWQFQAVDLRWGIPDEAGVDQKTVDLCLKEIRRCQQLSPRPNFLILLGDRYGWCPPPAEISQHEWGALVRYIKTVDRKLLDFWYKLDENEVMRSPDGRIGGMFELQPRRGEREKWAEYQAWEPVEKELRQMLLEAARKAKLPSEALEKYYASAIHQEIIEGAFKSPSAREHVTCFVREPASTIPASRVADLTDADPEKRAMLGELKRKLDSLLKENYHEYTADLADLDTQKPSIEWLDQRVYDELKAVIDGEMVKAVEMTPLEAEDADHRAFAENRALIFVGREDLITQIQEYVAGVAETPFWILGTPGSGKSALLSKAIDQIRKKNQTITIISRFIGTTSLSSDVRSLLPNLYQAITSAPGVSLKKDKGGKEPNREVPIEYPRLAMFMASFLRSIVVDRPLVVVLDAIDQFPSGDPGRDLQWLPDMLAPNLKVIVSAATDAADVVGMTRRRFANTIHDLPLLSAEDGERVLDLLLANTDRALQSSQRKEFLEKFRRSGSPLYLRVSFEIIRQWNSYDPPGKNILPDSLEGTINDFLDMVATNHVSGLVERVLGYIVCGRQGLSEQEIIDIVSSDKEFFDSKFHHHVHHSLPEARLPWITWARLHADLKPFLTIRDSGGVTTLMLFHRQFDETVKRRFLEGNNAISRHSKIASYYLNAPFWFGAPGQGITNGRKNVELVHQLLRAGMFASLELILIGLEYSEAKCDGGMMDDLLQDYAVTLDNDLKKLPRFSEIKVVYRFLQQQAHILRKVPHLFLQQAVNQGESASIEKEAEKMIFKREYPFIKWLNKSVGRDPCILTLLGHSSEIKSCSFSPDGNKIISSSGDKMLKLWEISTGRELHAFAGHYAGVNGCAFSPDGTLIVSASSDKTLRIWDSSSGQAIRILKGHTGPVIACAFSPDGSKILSGSWDKTLKLWDTNTGNEIRTFTGHSSRVEACCFLSEGLTIVSASGDSTLKLWEANSGKEIRTIRGHLNAVISCSVSPSIFSDIVSASWDNTVKVWDACTGECRYSVRSIQNFCVYSPDGTKILLASIDKDLHLIDSTGNPISIFKGHTSAVRTCAFSPDGTKFVSGSNDGIVKVWDLHISKEYHSIKSHALAINGCAFSPDGHYLVTASSDKTLMIWDAQLFTAIRTLSGHLFTVNSCAFSPRGDKIASTSNDEHLKLWDASSGHEIGESDGENCCAFSPDGDTIVSDNGYDLILSSTRSKNTLWNTHKNKDDKNNHRSSIKACSFSPDGTKILSGSPWESMRLWDASTGRSLAIIDGSGGSFCVFTPDGTEILSGHPLRLWDAHSFRLIQDYSVQSQTFVIQSCAFLPDGRVFVTASDDATIRLWNKESGNIIAEFHTLAPLKCITICKRFLIAAGDTRGFVYFLEIENMSNILLVGTRRR